MVDSEASSVAGSTLRSFSLVSRWSQSKHAVVVDPASDSASVISNAGTARGSLFGKTILVHTDSSSEEEEEDARIYPNEFVIQCQDDERVFVTTAQGKKILKRCRPLRELVLESCHQGNGQILHEPGWSAANVRRLIEISTTGSTWIENDASKFADFQKAAKELSMDIRLTSLINNQDMLTSTSTDNFFEMMHFENYQFKLSAALKSSQWLQLLRMGILLMSNSKLLAVKLACYKNKPSNKNTEGPSEDRLLKCDGISSEFCVYSKGNMQAVVAITSLLAASHAMATKSKEQHPLVGEDIKVIFKLPRGSLSHEELTMLWRMTDSSFTVSSKEDQAYLESFQTEELLVASGQGLPTTNEESKRESKDLSDEPALEHSENSSDTASTEAFSSLSVPNKIAIDTTSVVGHSSPTSPTAFDEYQCRTLSGRSFFALKHLFDSMNTKEPGLVACLVVREPTPDTLGRLINATRETHIARLDFDVQSNVFYACKTSSDIKKMLDYMADYSNSAVIKGDFQLCQRTL